MLRLLPRHLVSRAATALAGQQSIGLLKQLQPSMMSIRRNYSSSGEKESSGSGPNWAAIAAVLAGSGAAFYVYQQQQGESKKSPSSSSSSSSLSVDYQAVYKAIADLLESNSDYDDGSYGPILVRLAWHAAGTYDKETGSGGSNGATMRFSPESAHGANAGLAIARDLLEKVKLKFPDISYSDLWSLGGVVAIQEMGGPTIPWRGGRKDAVSETACTPDGRLPDASQGQSHLRTIFYRMGFNDQEIVALSGAHALGRCHTDRSGFEGPWTRSPITFSNDYFKLLLSEKWQVRKWSGPKQFEDKGSKALMMLSSDMSLLADKEMKQWVELYAKDGAKFSADFASAFGKLLELGVPFEKGTEPITLKRV